MELQKAINVLKAYKFGGYATLMDIRVMFNAIDTVLAELDRLQDENKEMKDVIEIMQDEIKHIPSIVSETM